MTGFKWHSMAEKMPEKGKKNYLVIGIKGGLYLATRVDGFDNIIWFRDTRGNHLHPEQVLAWAEVPPLEVLE